VTATQNQERKSTIVLLWFMGMRTSGRRHIRQVGCGAVNAIVDRLERSFDPISAKYAVISTRGISDREQLEREPPGIHCPLEPVPVVKNAVGGRL
jgi:hypothetical protein